MADKVKFLQANDHVLVGNMGSESTQLAPGQRVRLNEENDAHKGILQEIEEGTNTVLEVIEVDLKAEGKATEEREEMLEKADKIAAEQRAEEARSALEQQEKVDELRQQAEEEGQPAPGQQSDFPPQDVEAQKLARESGAGQRASTQEDVVEESSGGGRQGRRSSRKNS
jgi:nucleotide-binding universal stress UspA family protein